MSIIDELKKEQRNCDHDYIELGEEQEEDMVIGNNRRVTSYVTPMFCPKCLFFDMFSWS